jgi:hypothetical protein
MEIGALNTSNFTLSAVAETRVPRVAVEKAPKNQLAAAREDQKDVLTKAARAQAENLRAAQEAQREQDNQTKAGGSIQLDLEEGAHVMKVLDSKDILIYQVPSKGELAVVKAEEAAARRMLVSA